MNKLPMTKPRYKWLYRYSKWVLVNAYGAPRAPSFLRT